MEGLAGIEGLLPAYKKIRICPGVSREITACRASYLSVYGEIQTDWQWTEGKFKITFVIPPNTSARVELPIEKDGSYTTPKEDRWEMFDAGIAAQTFCLAAHEKGLGTVIMGIFDENKVGQVVEIPEGQTLAAIIPIGFPADGEVACPPRKAAEDLISFV